MKEIICLKLAKNSLKIYNFKKLFPEYENCKKMKTRNKEKFCVAKCYGKRYAVSAVPSMQRLLMLNKE